MCGDDMSPYSVSGAKPQPPNVFLDIIGAYVSAGCQPNPQTKIFSHHYCYKYSLLFYSVFSIIFL